MRRDDRNDPFDDIFRELERMMNDVMGGGVEINDAGFGSDTHVDIYETDEEIRVIADLPGVEKGDIGLTCDGKSLTISAANDHREYDERIALPGQVDEHSARATYNNGVLEVMLSRADGSAAIDVD
ncbi:Hsp20/alpha crystallin family protein [Halalkalicoccus jeotgali]|uniref:Heat shock protein Hsp20 n=1 Tax=Halalkalicoccus jeotgali (strain DSM 18796 / CECT 7217 / JCM 14584 / KCTC 4019 / B3) TaxID=795797 RepID=D8J924_HALJB|nr:Hsp20/alpha crystallin family protein [Halalkalicoccus jeotgali]ADJ16293.1 heat shock protein Hsp20 [Halalkalicoccus jeotgali B3]ELY37027.1 heat shock protein Hsp20 [Halalkalicoccus jeotgali B3]